MDNKALILQAAGFRAMAQMPARDLDKILSIIKVPELLEICGNAENLEQELEGITYAISMYHLYQTLLIEFNEKMGCVADDKWSIDKRHLYKTLSIREKDAIYKYLEKHKEKNRKQ